MNGKRKVGIATVDDVRARCVMAGGDTRRKRQDGVRTLADIRDRCVIDDETGCWLWRGAMSRSTTRRVVPTSRVWLPEGMDAGGQPTITTAGRAAWVLSGRALPKGHVVWRSVCHRCDCVNPAHGTAVTRQAMHKAIAASGRLRGDPVRAAVNARNRASLLTPREIVLQAEAMFAAGCLQKDVRAALGLCGATAARIRRGVHPHSSARHGLLRGASVFAIGAYPT